MTLARRVLRLLRPVIETLLAGALVGVVAAAIIGELVGGGGATSTGEVPLARNFVFALLHNDTTTMNQLWLPGNAASNAVSLQKIAGLFQGVDVESVTYVGGVVVGGMGAHVYVVQEQDANGQHLKPLTLTLSQGHVVYVYVLG